MITKDVYEQLGRMTVTFTALQEQLEHWCCVFHRKGRAEARKRMAESEPTVGRMAPQLRDQVDARARKLGLAETDDTLLQFHQVLDRTIDLTKTRNLLVHGALSQVPELETTYISKADQPQELTAELVSTLDADLGWCWNELDDVGFAFWQLTTRVAKGLHEARGIN
jgi:hypothetical protein